jgi:hypothetical protein
MPDNFRLVIAADDKTHSAEFHLLDFKGAQLAYHFTDFKKIPVSRQQGLFDLRNYLRNYVEAANEAASAALRSACASLKTF